MAVKHPQVLRAVLAGAALIASAAAAAALASSRTAASPPQPPQLAPVPVPDPPQDEPPQEAAPVPVRRGRRLWRLLRLIPVLAMIAASIWGAIALKEPDWARWTLIGLALVLPTCLGIALLIGPVARRLAGETTPLTAAERQQMTASERVEAVNAARHTLIQAVTGLVVIGGVVFTAGGLYYTAQTWQTGQETLKATQQQQITDRYTKAVEQLGSAKSVEVRLGGLYALKRIAQDSPPDAATIEDVVVAFILEHDLDKETPLKASARRRPGSDVSAALRVLGVISKSRGSHPDISSAQFAQADWRGVNLSGAYLNNANLSGANLIRANLAGADLSGADLSGADLSDGANLSYADLSDGANLRHGANLSYANLSGADLRSADLSGADLRHANLSGANLRHGANLIHGTNLIRADLIRPADLSGADLSGANLSGVRGMTAAEIKDMAITDAKTKF